MRAKQATRSMPASLRLLFFALVITAMLPQALCHKDYYRILGVGRNADEKEIKKAYKKLSKKFHPDIVAADKKEAAQKKFVEISEAYQTLKDPKKRQLYDQDFEQQQNNPGAGAGHHGNPFGGGGGFHFSSGGGRGGGINIDDILGGMFGGFGGGGGQRRKQRGPPNDGFGGFGGFGGMGGGGMNDFGGFEQPQKKQVSFKDSEVLQIEEQTKYEINDRRRLVLSVFYSPNALKDEEVEAFKNLATKYKGIMNIVAVNCEKVKSVCQEFGIRSVPTIRVFPEDRSKETYDYKGHIDLHNLERETIARLENHLIKVGKRNYQSFKARALAENKHIFIVYPTKKTSSPLFMSLSTLFKDKIMLMEEDLDDRLSGSLSAPSRPAVTWVRNLHSDELDVYDGKIDRTYLSLWIQDRANRKQAAPDKTVEELTKFKAQSVCNRADGNFCVIGVYTTDRQKADYTKLFDNGLKKYKAEPITFYTLRRSALSSTSPLTEGLVILRSKRGKYSTVDSNELYTKIDNLLNGSQLDSTLSTDLVNMFN